MSIFRAYSRFLRRNPIIFLLGASTMLFIVSYNRQHRPELSEVPRESQSFFFFPLTTRKQVEDPISKGEDDLQLPQENVGGIEAPNVFVSSGQAGDFVPLEKSTAKSKAKNENVEKHKNNMIKSEHNDHAFLGTVVKRESDDQGGRTASEIEYIKRETSFKDVQSSQGILEHQLGHQASISSNLINNSSTFDSSGKVLYRYGEIIDKKRKTKKIWNDDSICEKFKVHFARLGALSPCALASYPGSGNTYTRKLIEYASGLFTGSIYNDQQLFINGYYGELENWSSGTTIAQKTHDCGPTHVDAFNQTAILLLRNPYRAILSFHNYLFAGHTGFAPVSNYRRKDWSTFVHIEAKSWLELAINWTTKARPEALTVIHYENLTEDPLPDLDRVLRNRGFDPDHRRLDCLKKAHAYKTFKRRTVFIPEKLAMFSARDRDKIDRAIRYVDYLLRQKGQQPLPLHLYEFYNKTEATHVTRVPCHENETQAQCDDRVDMLNKIRGKNKTVGEMINESLNRPNTILSPGSEKAKEDIDRFGNTRGANTINTLLGALLSSIKKDPLEIMFHEPAKADMFRRDLQLEAEDYPETTQLKHDFKGVHPSRSSDPGFLSLV